MMVKFRGGPKCNETMELNEPLPRSIYVQTVPPMALNSEYDPIEAMPEPLAYALMAMGDGLWEYWLVPPRRRGRVVRG